MGTFAWFPQKPSDAMPGGFCFYNAMQKEAVIQTSICSILKMFGYTVVEIGKTRRALKCHKCGTMNMATGWQGNTPGAPDLIVTAPKWGTLWVGLEVKRPGGAVRDAQKKLLNEGSICIVKSVRDALSQIIEIEKHFGNVTDRLEVVLNQLDRDNVHTKQ